MHYRHFVLLLLFMAVLLTQGCQTDNPTAQDTEPPVITVSSPKPGDSFKRGTQIAFEAVLEDNVALAVYNINIHENFDGHTHGRLAASPMSFDKSFTVSGRRAVVSEKIDIPADATPGDYHFIVRAIDDARNATSFADGSTREIDIKITE